MPELDPRDCAKPDGCWYSYAIIQVVPRVERGEAVNIGIILFARTMDYLVASVELSEERLLGFAPGLDLDQVKEHLQTFQAIAAGQPEAGPVAILEPSERFHWLTSPRSTVIQTSPVHVGWCTDPAICLEELMTELVRW